MPPPEELVPFLALAKGARGRAAADVVVRAIEALDVHVFGELLDVPSVKELASSPDLAPYHALLSIFAFGSWADYKREAAQLPRLSTGAAAKLKALTLAALAGSGNAEEARPSAPPPSAPPPSSWSRRTIPYSALAAAVDAASTPELEDLLIRGVLYAGLVDGKLDQRGGGCLRVKSVPASLAGSSSSSSSAPAASASSSSSTVVGSKCRDVPPDQLKQLAEELSSWRDAVSGAAKRLEAAGISALIAEAVAGATAEAARAEAAVALAAAYERVSAVSASAAANASANNGDATARNAAGGTAGGGGGGRASGRREGPARGSRRSAGAPTATAAAPATTATATASTPTPGGPRRPRPGAEEATSATLSLSGAAAASALPTRRWRRTAGPEGEGDQTRGQRGAAD